MGYMFCMGSCCGCGAPFTFNPERVPSIRAMRKDGKWVLDPNGSREPVCANCIARGNAEREKRGMPLIHVLPGAYEEAEDGEL